MTHAAADGQHRTFTVRMWSENVGEGVEHRGRVHDVSTGAFRRFRGWSELNEFLAERLGEGGRREERSR